MILTIHRGTKVIGGSCIEIESRGHRLILDLGLPLMNEDGSECKVDRRGKTTGELIQSKVLPKVPGLYATEGRNGTGRLVDALVLSHAHQDHYGLADHVHPEIPIYASIGTQAIIHVSSLFLRAAPRIRSFQELRRAGDRRGPYDPVRIGPFSVQPYPVDHSAPDAVALLVEAGGKRVFYTGDLGSSGRTGYRFESLVSSPPREVDLLVMEGTLVGSETGRRGETGGRSISTEEDVQEELERIFKEKPDLALVFCSTQNLGRLVSIYKAARNTGKVFVIDLYTAYLLQELRVISDSLPQFHWRNMAVFYSKDQADRLVAEGRKPFLFEVKGAGGKIGPREIEADPARYVMLGRSGRKLRIALNRARDPRRVRVIWSMYGGYLSRDEGTLLTFKKHGIEPVHVHVSGHASIACLKRLAGAISPKRIVPIHTLGADHFGKHFESVVDLSDGAPLAV